MKKSMLCVAACFSMLMANTSAKADWQSAAYGFTTTSSTEKSTKSSRKQTYRASLGSDIGSRPAVSGRRSSTSDSLRRSAPITGGGGVSWVASSGCLNGSLKSVIYSMASSFGSVRVNSTCRSASHNRRVGGATKSYHLTGDAADFRVFGSVSAAYASLRSNGSVGGLKHYGGGLFHIDTGPRRGW
jgi:hypothetical protein